MRRAVSFMLLIVALVFVLATSCGILKVFPKTVVLQATDTWLATGINVDSGDLLRISATGTISVHPDHGNIGPDGDANIGTPTVADPEGAISYPMPDELVGALVGRIGSSGAAFLIGADAALTAGTTGELYMIINDNYMENNSGFFDVAVQFEGGLF